MGLHQEKYIKFSGSSQDLREFGLAVKLSNLGDKSLDFIKGCLKAKLKPYYLNFWRDGNYLIFKAIKRGTEDYVDYYLKPRFKEIRDGVKMLIRVDRRDRGLGLTNAFFVTFTFSGEFTSFETWQALKDFSKVLDKVKKKFKRRGYKVIGYVRVFEAHLSGKAHVHLLVIFDKSFWYRYDVKKRRGFIKDQKVYDELKGIFESVWGYGFVDIQPVSGVDDAISYVSKYAFKSGGEVESVFDKVDLSEGDIKKLYLYFYLMVFGLRFFSVSLRLDKGFNNNNSDAGGGWIRFYPGPEFDRKIEALRRLGVEVILIRGSPEGVEFKVKNSKGVISWLKVSRLALDYLLGGFGFFSKTF